jgi:hypothetical protein
MPPRRQTRRTAPLQITAADRHRYNLFRDGVSTAEIATRDRVPVAQVEKSILRCREERQNYSQEAIEVGVRQMVLSKLPEAGRAISGALGATRYQNITVLVKDPETNESVEMSESVEVPDHKTRLSGHSALVELLNSIKVSAPMVNVDARQQTQNVLGLPAHATGQPSSAEAIIREIRAARGLALTDGATIEGSGNVAALAEIDTELAEEIEEDEEESDEDESLEPDDAE